MSYNANHANRERYAVQVVIPKNRRLPKFKIAIVVGGKMIGECGKVFRMKLGVCVAGSNCYIV